jgi:hypothetical protein
MVNRAVVGSRPSVLVFLTACGLLFGGCAVEAPSPDPAPVAGVVSESAAKTQSERLWTDTISAAPVSCAPLTCCFGAGAEWSDNPFENDLQSLGCTKPVAYAQKAGTSDWYLYSECRLSLELFEVVFEYSKVAPFNAEFASDPCLKHSKEMEPILTDSVFVEFDPTCPSCYPNMSLLQ